MFSLLSDPLPAIVKSRYRAAVANSSVVYSPSELAVIPLPSGAPIQVRFCPSLSKKSGSESDPAPKPRDPFDNPSGDLYIGEIGNPPNSYVLVLNKFPIIANHFILATKEFKQQTDALEPEDLEATFACLKEWETASSDGASPGRLFAFFNSGIGSGASQPHRHVQLLPIEDMREGDVDGEWSPLIDRLADNPDAPPVRFTYYVQKLPSDSSPATLHRIYSQLLQSSRTAGMQEDPRRQGTPEKFSYNMAMTTTAIILLPRVTDTISLGSGLGDVNMNGTILAGTLMVKQKQQFEYFKSDPVALHDVIRCMGVLKIC